MFYETYVLKKFMIFARKHLSWRHFLISIVTKRLQHRCFPVNIPKFLRTYFSWNTSGGCFYKNFANSNRIFLYRSHFLSSCRTITCNFVKKEGPVRVFCCEFREISPNNFMQSKLEWLLLNVKRCCGK